MEYDLSDTRLPYRGWEIRSHLTSVSIDGTVAAGAVLFVGDVCKCYIVSCKQFVNGSDAISAIEQKAARWIDVREASLETSPVSVEPVALRQSDQHEPNGKRVDQPERAQWVHREAPATAGAVQGLAPA
jgi:hypothetical protein